MRLLATCALCATCLWGCSDISLQTVDSHERVMSRHKRVVEGNAIKVQSRLDGTMLYLQTTRGCDRVEMEEVERTDIREADEDTTEEAIVLGFATIPLTAGIVMLADAPNVYDNDRNSRLYNQAGPEGAYIGGTLLTAAGGILAMAAIVEMGRIASAGDVVTSTVGRQGRTLATNVPCEGASQPTPAAVTLDVGGTILQTVGTSSDGKLALDLAEAVPPEVANNAVSIRVLVAGKAVGELDIEPILDEQARRAKDKPLEVPEPDAVEPPPTDGAPTDGVLKEVTP